MKNDNQKKDDKGFTPEEEAFLNKHFKAGEYSIVSLMVPHNQMGAFVEYLQKSNLNLVIMPGIRPQLEFVGDKKGTPQ